MVQNLPAMQETWVWPLGWKDPLGKGMATYSSGLAWRIPWKTEPGRWQFIGSQRVGHDWETNTFTVFQTLYAFQLLKPSSLFKLWWKSILYPWLQKRHLREQRHKAWKETEKQKRALNISSQTIILKYILDISFFLTAPHPYSSCQPQRPSKSASIVPILYPCHCYSNSAVIFPWLLSWAKSCPLIIRMLKS